MLMLVLSSHDPVVNRQFFELFSCANAYNPLKLVPSGIQTLIVILLPAPGGAVPELSKLTDADTCPEELFRGI